jgi:hypothetical protein
MRNRKRRRLIQQEPTPVIESIPTPAPEPVVEELAAPEEEVKPRKRKSLFSKD